MKVSDVMTEATISDRAEDPIVDAARLMWEQQTGSLLVVEDGDRLVGIITERDIMKAVAVGLDLAATTVRQVMASDPVTINAGASLREAAKIMTEHWIRHLPVIERGRLVGIISQRDLSSVLSGALNEPEALEQLVESSELARERRLKRIELGAWD